MRATRLACEPDPGAHTAARAFGGGEGKSSSLIGKLIALTWWSHAWSRSRSCSSALRSAFALTTVRLIVESLIGALTTAEWSPAAVSPPPAADESITIEWAPTDARAGRMLTCTVEPSIPAGFTTTECAPVEMVGLRRALRWMLITESWIPPAVGEDDDASMSTEWCARSAAASARRARTYARRLLMTVRLMVESLIPDPGALGVGATGAASGASRGARVATKRSRSEWPCRACERLAPVLQDGGGNQDKDLGGKSGRSGRTSGC